MVGTLEVETTLEDRTRERRFAKTPALLGEEVEGAQADGRVEVVSHPLRSCRNSDAGETPVTSR
jgi:hypothetical protein